MAKVSDRWELVISHRTAAQMIEDPDGREDDFCKIIVNGLDHEQIKYQLGDGQNIITIGGICFVADCFVSGRKI